MCVEFSPNLRDLSLYQVLHVMMENSAKIANKISRLHPDRVLHEIPGKSAQWRG
jgi:hypothetical protein